MTTLTALTNLSLIAMVTVAAVSDARTRRIPNWLVGAGLVVALVTQCMAQGLVAGSVDWLGGTATGMALLLGVYLIGGIGAGDVKLMGAVGAFMGPAGGLQVALASFLAGGVLVGIVLLTDKDSRRVIAGLPMRLFSLRFGVNAAVAQADEMVKGKPRRGAAKLPYAVAIAAGTLLVKWKLL